MKIIFFPILLIAASLLYRFHKWQNERYHREYLHRQIRRIGDRGRWLRSSIDHQLSQEHWRLYARDLKNRVGQMLWVL